MKHLVINPHTTKAVTRLVAEAARVVASPSMQIVTVTGRFGWIDTMFVR